MLVDVERMVVVLLLKTSHGRKAGKGIHMYENSRTLYLCNKNLLVGVKEKCAAIRVDGSLATLTLQQSSQFTC